MYADYNLHALQYREIQEQEFAERMAESTRRVLAASLRPSLRAHMAHRLFALRVPREVAFPKKITAQRSRKAAVTRTTRP